MECFHTYKYLARQNNIEFILDIDDEISSYICSDRTIIRLILMNLVDNAIQHTLNGTVIIKLICYQKQHIKVIVKDTGEGIEEQTEKQMFDIYKLQNLTLQAGDVQPVAQLGLKICQQLISGISGGRPIEYRRKHQNGSSLSFVIQDRNKISKRQSNFEKSFLNRSYQRIMSVNVSH